MNFMLSFLLGTLLFGPPSRALVVITWREVGCRIHDAVGINCINGATTENQVAYVKYIWAWHNYPSLMEGESSGMLLWYYYIL